VCTVWQPLRVNTSAATNRHFENEYDLTTNIMVRQLIRTMVGPATVVPKSCGGVGLGHFTVVHHASEA
jgi:hypothetical protein